MSEQLLAVTSLRVEYRLKALRTKKFVALNEINISIGQGETLGLVGESGSGKSTLGRAVLGLAAISHGSVLFAGEDITHASRRRRRQLGRDLQVIFQDPYSSLNPSMSVGEILAEPLIAAGIDGKSSRARVSDLLDRVNLPRDSMNRLPREFSGGQRQRVAIARALALDPKLIVCDEPVSALDLSTQSRILDLLLEIQQRSQVSYLFVSHDLDVVRHISHRVAVMHRGEIVEQGSAVAVTTAPDHEYTRRLLMASPVADPDRQAERRRARLSMSVSLTESANAIT